MTDKNAKNKAIDALTKAFASLENPGEAEAFLNDLCTPAELSALAERWRIACTLDAGGMSYRDIASSIGASTTTVARVARFLREEPHQGYRQMLDKNKS